jgi:hypothetical protein
MPFLQNIQVVAQCATAKSQNEHRARTHFSIHPQPDLGVAAAAETFKGWGIAAHPIAGYTLENREKNYILGRFATRAAAAKFAGYLPAAADCDFGSIRFDGGVA